MSKNMIDQNQAKAYLKGLRIGPQKVNLLMAMIRGLPVDRAVALLRGSRKRASKDVLKLLNSAIANAENNHGLDIDELFVREAHVGKGLVMKRWHARARGRSAKILKPFSNLSICLEVRQES